MIWIAIAVIVAAVIAVMLMRYSCTNFSTTGTIAAIVGVVLAGLAGLAAASFSVKGWDWYAAGHKARLINQEFGTQYTQEDVFWASDVIEEIRQLDRKRIELNGDLGRGE